jgi:FkbM family methyltransferase
MEVGFSLVTLFFILVTLPYIKTIFVIYKNHYKVGPGLINFMYIYHEVFYGKDYDLGIDLNHKVIFDMGCNMGIFSLWLNENFQHSEIHCFEPVKEIFELASHNIQQTNKTHQYHLNNIGLSNETRSATINYYPKANGLSTVKEDLQLKIDKVPFYQKILVNQIIQKPIKEKISLVKTKDYLEEKGIKKIDFCKIDVEGSEKEILEGFENYIDIVDAYIIEVESFRESTLESVQSYLSNYDIKINKVSKNCCILVARKKQGVVA